MKIILYTVIMINNKGVKKMYTKYNDGDWTSEKSWKDSMREHLEENIKKGASFESGIERCWQLQV